MLQGWELPGGVVFPRSESHVFAHSMNEPVVGDKGHRRRCLAAALLLAATAAVWAGCGGGSKSSEGTPQVAREIESPGSADSRSSRLANRNRRGDGDRQDSPPFVVRLERDLDMHETAARALGRIGAPAVLELRRALTDVDPSVRIQAAEVLARIGPQAEEAVPDLIVALDDENEEVRKAAARALGQIGPAAAAAVPALMRSMRESEELLPPSPNGK